MAVLFYYKAMPLKSIFKVRNTIKTKNMIQVRNTTNISIFLMKIDS